MKKIALSVILLAGCVQQCFAQADNNVPAPQLEKKKAELTHQVGVQLNGLIRQVFNFSNSTANTNTNPYLLTYSLNFRSGWGARLGVGYNYASKKESDVVTTETKTNTLRGRIGAEKLFKLSDKWTAGAGADFVVHLNDDITTTTQIIVDTLIIVNKSKGTGLGGGPMAWLRYRISDHVLIGTETSFYYVATKPTNTKVETLKTLDQFGSGSISSTKTEIKKPQIAEGVFSAPIAFYIIVRF